MAQMIQIDVKIMSYQNKTTFTNKSIEIYLIVNCFDSTFKSYCPHLT